MSNGMITLGADPEFFLQDTRTGAVTPAIGLLGGTKQEPLRIPGLGKGFGMQEDNVMVEFNIPPTETEYVFTNSIMSALRVLREHINTVSEGRLTADLTPSRLFPHEALTHPQAAAFGCSPDFNAYAAGEPHKTVDPQGLVEKDGAWRFAGGHVHIGFRDVLSYKLPDFVVVQFLDLILGTYAAAWEVEQGKRGEFYGVPGRYRPTPYGLEYRSLSNLWLRESNRMEDVSRLARHTILFLMDMPEKQVATIYGQVPWMSLYEALKSGNVSTARGIRQHVCNEFRSLELERYF